MADENLDGHLNDGEEFEEITSEEVDRVVEQLEKLIESVSSENIKSYLEEAANNIFFFFTMRKTAPTRPSVRTAIWRPMQNSSRLRSKGPIALAWELLEVPRPASCAWRPF